MQQFVSNFQFYLVIAAASIGIYLSTGNVTRPQCLSVTHTGELDATRSRLAALEIDKTDGKCAEVCTEAEVPV